MSTAGANHEQSSGSEVVVVDRVVAGGDGLARLADGRVVFVEGTLPGERVEVELTDIRRDHAKGRLRRVEVASEARTRPVCPQVDAGCGGCGWAHVRPDRQVALAEEVVADALARIAGLGRAPLLEGRGVDAPGHRTTGTLAVAPDGRLGYHRRHDAELVPVPTCRVVHPLIEELIPKVRAPGWATVTLRASAVDGTRLAVLGTGQRGRRRRPGPDRAGGPPSMPEDVVVVRPGRDGHLVEEVAGRRWRVSARSFFQSGPAAAELLVEEVDEALGDDLPAGARLVDAYAGVGLLGGSVAARRDLRLASVEASPSATADAAVNLADLEASVTTCPLDRWRPVAADAVIADPARPGLGRPGVAALAATGAPRVVLVSCDPASFARDVGLLREVGYRLVRARVLGLFPDTAHLEVVARFDRADGAVSASR